MYLQQSSKLYIQKRNEEKKFGKTLVELVIRNNTAQYGGGIFVADSTESGACRGEDETTAIETECFIQTLNLHGWKKFATVDDQCYFRETKFRNTFLTNNTATRSGADIYGGLLDRCTVSETAEFRFYSSVVFQKYCPFLINSFRCCEIAIL